MNSFIHYIIAFGIAMLPVFELRGAIPYGVAMGLNFDLLFIVSVLGNMLPVPLIIIFIRNIFKWMKKRSEFLQKIALKMENRALLKSKLIKRYELIGLIILVAIPLPGTGAWTGALIAAMLDIRLKHAVPAILLGVIIAGIIITYISYGIGMFFGK